MVMMGNYVVQNSSQFLNARRSVDCLTNIVFRVPSYLELLRINDDKFFISQKDLSFHELYRTLSFV
jgi:hypothetical protein